MSSSPTGSSDPGLPAGLRGVLLAAAAAAVLLLSFPGAMRLVNPDEPRDSEIAREWADGGWTLLPRCNGDLYWAKPPAYHVSAGLLMRATGSQEEWVPKATAALWGIACVAATAALGEALLGPGLGLLSGLILLSTHFFHVRFRTATTDTAFAALTAIAFLALFAAHKRGGIGYWVLFGLAAGLAALAKGAHGLLFPVAAGAVLLAVRREWRALPRLGVALAAGVAVFGAWCLALRFRASEGGGPELLDLFLFGNWERRFGNRIHHEGGALHYAVLLPRAAPWMLAAAAGACAVLRPGAERGRLLLPLAWAGVTVLGLSLAAGKRTVYLLPVLPAVALLAAGGIDAAARGELRRWPDRLARWTVEALSLPLRSLPFARRGLRERAVLGAAVAAAASLAWILLVTGPRSHGESSADFARAAAAAAGDRPLVLFRQDRGEMGQFLFPLRRTLPAAWTEEDLRRIAAGRPVAVLAEPHEVALSVERGRIPAALIARWTVLAAGSASGTPYRVYAWDGR